MALERRRLLALNIALALGAVAGSGFGRRLRRRGSSPLAGRALARLVCQRRLGRGFRLGRLLLTGL